MKIGIMGNGWRTASFLNVINALPSLFTFGGMYFRDAEKAKKFDEKYKGLAFTDKDEFYSQNFDFVIVVLPRSVAVEHCEEAFKRNVAVLCETPPADGIEELNKIYELKLKYNAKIQVLEQYFCQPYHSALLKIVESGKLGNVSNIDISMIHDYHAISMIRKLLDVGFDNCKIHGKKYSFPVTKTCSRAGITFDGEVLTAEHKRAVFEFENGKTAFYNFSGEQYFNYLRTRHLQLQGDRGELVNYNLAWLNSENAPVNSKIQRCDLGKYSNLEGYCNRGILLDGEYIYKNPYEGARLSDDEIAIASIFEGMGNYVHGGNEIYSLENALQDTYLYLLMDEAVNSGKIVNTAVQKWCE